MKFLNSRSVSNNRIAGVCQLVLCAMMLWGATQLQAQITLDLTPSRTSIYLGESFNLNAEIKGADKGISTPEFVALQDAELAFLGQHSNSRSSISIINGKITREVFKGRVFAWQIKPHQAGSFSTGPVQVKHGKQVFTHPGVTVQVAGVEQQDVVVLALEASSTALLIEEPFTLTLSVAVAELPEPYAEHEPLHPKLPPHLSAGFLEIRQPDPGLKEPDLNQILSALVDRRGDVPAFSINEYQSRDFGGFSSFFNADPFKPRPVRFRLKPERKVINHKKYRVYQLTLDYTPLQEGEFTFGPLSFKGSVIVGVDKDRQAVTQDIYTIGPAVTVRVIPPPEEGMPEHFIGSVGRSLTAEAAFDTAVCKVGDPLTLTLEVQGELSLANMRTPLLSLQPELTKDFRIYDDNVASETLRNGKRFKYRIRPTREGTIELPPIKLAYYNTAQRSYVTVATAPVPLQALPTTQIATMDNSDTYADGSLWSGNGVPMPSGMILSQDGIHVQTLLPDRPVWLSLLVIGPCLGVLLILLTPLRTIVRQLKTHARYSGALHRTLRLFKKATTPAQVSGAMRFYMTARLDADGDALTATGVGELLCRCGVSEVIAQQCQLLLGNMEAAMYSSTDLPLDRGGVQELSELLRQIDAQLSQAGNKQEEGLPLGDVNSKW